MDMKKTSLFALCFMLTAHSAVKAEIIDGQALSWHEAVSVMLRGNPQNLSSKAQQDYYLKKIAAAEGVLYPQAGVKGSYTRMKENAGYDESYSYGLTASYALYDPASRSDLRQSRIDYRQAETSDQLLKSKLFYLLRQAFTELSYAQDSLALSEQTLKRRQDNAALLQLKYGAGRESHAAMLETDALVKTAEWDRDRCLKNVRIAARNLNVVLGRPLATPARATEISLATVPVSFDGFGRYIDAHPSVREKKLAVDGALEALARAKTGRLPTAMLTANYSWDGYSWPDNEPDWNAGLNLNWNFFTGGKVKNTVQAQRSAVTKAEQDQIAAFDSVYSAAEDGYYLWREAASYVGVAQGMLDAMKDRAWLVQTQYMSGQSTYFEWREVESQLISSQQQLVAARRDLALAYAGFVKAIGLGEYPL